MKTLAFLTVAITLGSAWAGLAHAEPDAAVTRAQVLAELKEARASGELAAMTGEDSGSFWLSQRDQQLRQAMAKGRQVAACAGDGCAPRSTAQAAAGR